MYLTTVKKILGNNYIKRIAKNSGIILGGSSASSAINLISFTLMAKQLGPELLAILVISQTYSLILNDVFNVQTWESMVKFGAANLTKEKMVHIAKTNIILDVISALLAFIFALICIKPSSIMLQWDPQTVKMVQVYTFSILFNITTFTIGIPRLFNKFFHIAKIQIVVSLLKFVLVLAGFFYDFSISYFLQIYLLSEIMTNLALIIYSNKLLVKNYGTDWWRSKLIFDRDQLRFVWWTNLRTIIRIPVRHFDVIVINAVMSVKTLGIYKVYKEIAGSINRIGDPINQAVFPEFAKLLGSKQTDTTEDVTKKTMILMCIAGTCIVVPLIVLAKPILSTFFGAEYLEHINALYLMLVLFGMGFITVPINSLFIAAGFAKYSFMLLLFTNSVYLLVAFYFGQLLGLYGIIIAFASQLFLNQGLKIYYLQKYSANWGEITK